MDTQDLPRLAAIDFGPDISRLTEGFVGREWLFGEIDAWLERENERFFLLTGEPGVGKSAIAARLTQVREDIAAHHFCIAGRNSTVVPSMALRSLAAQLGEHLPGYGQALANTIDPIHLSVQVDIDVETMTGGQITGVVIEHLHASDPEEELDILLRAPLAELPAPPAPLLILVDSLDEAVTHRGEVNLVTLLAGVDDLPPWVRFVCTSRPERRVLRYFDGLSPYVLGAESQMNLEDVGRYITYRAAKEGMQARLQVADVEPEHLADRVAELADGNFLYAKVLLNDVEAGRQPLDDLEALPRSLDEIYHGFLTRFTVREWEERYQPLLGILAVAQEPLVEAQLAGFSGLRRTKVRQYLGVVRQFLDEREDGEGHKTYTLFHQSLRDYLLEEERSKGFWCAPEDGHEKIGEYYQGFWDRWAECDLYGLRHLPVHLMGAGQLAKLRALLLNFGWLQAKLEATDVTSLIADYDLLPGDADARLVGDALRLSAYALAEDRTQLRGQLLGRLLGRPERSIQDLLAKAVGWDGAPWLRPLTTCLEAPGGALVCTLMGHTAPVNVVAITPDGCRAVSGSDDKTLKVWDLDSGQEVLTWVGHEDAVTFAAIMPDGRQAVSVSGYHRVIMWDLSTGEKVRTLNVDAAGPFLPLALAPDGRYLVTPTGDWYEPLLVWYLERGRCARKLEARLSGRVSAMAITPDGQRILAGTQVWGSSGTLKVWTLETGEEVSTLKRPGSVTALAITPDGRHVIAGSENWLGYGTLKIWDLDSGQHLCTLKGWDKSSGRNLETWKGPGAVQALAITPDGQQAVAASGEELKVGDLSGSEKVRTMSGHTGRIRAVAISPDEHLAVTASMDKTLKVWNLDSKEETDSPRAHAEPVMAVAITPDGRHAISGSTQAGGPLKVWDLATGRHVRDLKGYSGEVHALAITPDGRYALQASYHMMNVWDLARGHRVSSRYRQGSDVTALVITPDGRCAVSASKDQTLMVWEISAGLGPSVAERLTAGLPGRRPVRTHLLEDDWISALAAIPHGPCVVSGSHGHKLQVWDVSAPREMAVHTLADEAGWIKALAVTPDGLRVVGAVADGELVVWEMESGRRLCNLAGHVGEVKAVATLPDGQHAVSVSDDRTLRVWELARGECQVRFRADGGLSACAVAPDAKTIVAGDHTGRLHFLRLESFD